jgi:hypothetical protein
MTPTEHLNQLFIEHYRTTYPAVPERAMPKQKYTDKTANGLTRMVIDFINYSGGLARRINTVGRVIKTKANKEIYIPTSGMRGSADITSTIPILIAGRTVGITVEWEVKMRDKQSDNQARFQSRMEAAHGQYYVVHSFGEFYQYYQMITG